MAVNPAVGAGFDGPPPSLPAPKVPKRAGEFTAHPAAPSPYRVRARGACRATPHPEIHILSSWALGGVHGGDIRVKPTRTRETGQPGGGPFGVWGDVLRGGPLPAVSSPRYGYALFRESLSTRSPPYICTCTLPRHTIFGVRRLRFDHEHFSPPTPLRLL